MGVLRPFGVLLPLGRQLLVDVRFDDLAAREDPRVLLLELARRSPAPRGPSPRPSRSLRTSERPESCSLSICSRAPRRSSSASTSRFSRALGSKRMTTSPCFTSEPSGASQPMRKGPGTPAGTEIGVARTAFRSPCAGTRRTNSGLLDPQRGHVRAARMADSGRNAPGRPARRSPRRRGPAGRKARLSPSLLTGSFIGGSASSRRDTRSPALSPLRISTWRSLRRPRVGWTSSLPQPVLR